MDNEKPVTARSQKWLVKKAKAMKQRIESNETVPFKIINITARGFLVKSFGLFAFVSFSDMPWKYKNLSFWKVVFPSLVKRNFFGYVSDFTEESLSINIRADRSRFDSHQFQYEIDEVYTAIVLKKTNSCLWLDFGYGMHWGRGSLPLNIAYYPDKENIDWFPTYNQGDEFRALYVGKSVAGNDIFSYDGTRYYSEEYKLVGQKIWVHLERTKSSYLCFLTKELYVGKLLLDEKDDLGTPYKLLQKILQTLPNGQRLWCKVVGITLDGTLLLKWLVDEAPPIEDVLSLYFDASILRRNDPLFPEEKKGLINKKVWCQPCEIAYPRKFKIDNQSVGTISLDANLYQDISLSLIVNTLEKIPENQQLFCKIKGMYPDGTFKLQWIVQWDDRTKKLVFPNKFSHKIILEQGKKQALVGKETWAIIRKNKTDNKQFFMVNGLYHALLEEGDMFQTKLLQQITTKTTILCKVLGVENDGDLRIKWLLPDSLTFSDITDISFAYNLPIAQPAIQEKNDEKEPCIGDELQLITKRSKKNELIFLVADKYIGKIIPDETNYPGFKRERIRRVLRKMQSGQQLLCKITRILPGFRMELRWMIENDPFAEQFQFVAIPEITSMEQNQEPEQQPAKQEKSTEDRPRVGDKLWLKAKRMGKYELLFLVANKYTGSIIIDKRNYPDHYSFVEKALGKVHAGQLLLCEILQYLPKYRVELRWVIEEDPLAKDFYPQPITQIENNTPNKIQENMQKIEKETLSADLVTEKEEAIMQSEKSDVEKIKVGTVSLKTLKVVGVIDLDAINARTKPRKKSKEERLIEKKERIRLEKERLQAIRTERIAKIQAEQKENIKQEEKTEEIQLIPDNLPQIAENTEDKDAKKQKKTVNILSWFKKLMK